MTSSQFQGLKCNASLRIINLITSEYSKLHTEGKNQKCALPPECQARPLNDRVR